MDTQDVVDPKDLIIADLKAQIEDLTRKLDAALRKLNQNSKNSSKPPSSDHRRGKTDQPRAKTGKKRGGQLDHEGAYRKHVPEDEVTHVHDLFPLNCEHCHTALPSEKSAHPERYQVTELPTLKAEVTEYRRHRVMCPQCNKTTKADVVGIVPKYMFGPRLMAFVGTLTGVFHLSRRDVRAFMEDAYGIDMSLGSLSTIESRVASALSGASENIYNHVVQSDVKHVDATGWIESGAARSLWVMATPSATTFEIFKDGTVQSISSWFKPLHGILVSDRATVFSFWPMHMRQICWAHLKRKFQAFSEDPREEVQKFGKELLDFTSVVFEHHHARRSGKISHEIFHHRIKPTQDLFEALLEHIASLNMPDISGSCSDILKHRQALWTFTERCDVEPTNNHAEQELRRFVLWRKSSFGSQSSRGHLFAATAMSIARTARKQCKSAFLFILESCIAWMSGKPGPSIFSSA